MAAEGGDERLVPLHRSKPGPRGWLAAGDPEGTLRGAMPGVRLSVASGKRTCGKPSKCSSCLQSVASWHTAVAYMMLSASGRGCRPASSTSAQSRSIKCAERPDGPAPKLRETAETKGVRRNSPVREPGEENYGSPPAAGQQCKVGHKNGIARPPQLPQACSTTGAVKVSAALRPRWTPFHSAFRSMR